MSGVSELIEKQRDGFLEKERSCGYGMKWESECFFAKQQLMSNDFLLKTARDNQKSLSAAIQNVAAIGVSLNPALGYAYLVPRKGAVCLDISYRGLLYIATESGAIEWAKADLVYKNDAFTYKGPATPPDHNADVFGERGEIIGVYCIAKLPSGDYLVDTMPRAEIDKIKAASATSRSDTPWNMWFEEMCKKAIFKRAAKTWPQVGRMQRVHESVSVVNEHEGIDFSAPEVEERALPLIENLESVALKGLEALQDSWQSMSEEDRQLVGSSFLQIKRQAAKTQTEEENNG